MREQLCVRQSSTFSGFSFFALSSFLRRLGALSACVRPPASELGNEKYEVTDQGGKRGRQVTVLTYCT